MNWCQMHWDQLKVALKERGLDKFGAKTGQQAINEMVDELDGRSHDFDPLMGSWNQINLVMANSLEKLGRRNEVLLLKCPLCILVEDGQPQTVKNWIDGVTDSALEYAIKEGLIKTQ